jgi:uncharacterized membrane protein HdeD (DUF308 family)
MLPILVRNSWLLALRGGLALAFAMFVFSTKVFAFGWLLHAMALASVVEWFGLLALGGGILTIIAAIREFHKEQGWWLLVDGSGACGAGILAVTVPGLTFIPLVRLIAVWALFVGSCECLMARKLRRHVPDEWFLAGSAIVSVAFGIYLLLGQLQQVQRLLLWLGSYALFSAVSMLALSLRLHNLRGIAYRAATHARSMHTG